MVSVEGIDRMIDQHPFFSGMPEEYQSLLVSCASNRVYHEGDYLMREGEKADHFYLIRHGNVHIEIHAPGRSMVSLESLQDGEILGWSWLIPPYRWLFDGRATHTTRVIAFDAACLREKAEKDCHLGFELYSRILPVMAERLGAARLRLLDLYANPSHG